MLRPQLWTQDWQRNRYLWTRFGYTRVYKASSGPAEVAEDRGVASVYGRFPLSDGAGLEGRARADLRWIGGERSTRYRLRAEANRETTVLDHTVVAYANIEWFYDTRYSGWSRSLAQAGPEITLSKAFRCEVYLARQVDRLPAAASLNALGVVAKWYY